MKGTGKILVGAALAALVARGSGATVLDTAFYNGHKYHLISENTWHGAETEAVSLGGHLATVNDLAENTFLWGQWGGSLNGKLGLYIGLNDEAVEGVYVWVSGEVSGFFNWMGGEPNNLGNEDFSSLDIRSAGMWNDNLNTVNYRGIVEVAPEPAALLLLGMGGIGLALLRRKR